MRRVLIDTNVYVAFKRNNANIVESFRHFDYIGVDVTVVAELLCGFKGGTKEKYNRIELEEFLNIPRVFLHNHNFETSEYYSLIFNSLKKKGAPIPTNDIWIAATAMQHGLTLFSLDSHFNAIEGLLLYNPLNK